MVPGFRRDESKLNAVVEQSKIAPAGALTG
jgi:hypothetical protein